MALNHFGGLQLLTPEHQGSLYARKKCCLRKTLPQEVVYDHLLAGAGILEGYEDWVMHGESINAPVNVEPVHDASTVAPVQGCSIHEGSSEMHAMLHDIFTMQDVRVEEGGA